MSDVLPSIIVLAITALLVFPVNSSPLGPRKAPPRAATDAARPSTAREASGYDSEGAASCVHRTEVTCGGDGDTPVILAFSSLGKSGLYATKQISISLTINQNRV